jgi:hypothetical protein
MYARRRVPPDSLAGTPPGLALWGRQTGPARIEMATNGPYLNRVSLCRWLAHAVCIAALSGCAVIDMMKPRQAEGGPAAVQPAKDAPPEKAASPAAPPVQQAVAVPDPKPAAPTSLAPRTLVGMTPEAVQKMLGAPAAQRSDPPATVWSWRHGKCEVEVFFYLDLGSQTMRALTYEFRGAPRREARCLGALKQEADRGRRATD